MPRTVLRSVTAQNPYKERRLKRIEWRKRRLLIGFCAVAIGYRAAARLTDVDYWIARYWRGKILDPNLHPLPWGGFRKLKYGTKGDKII